MSSPASSSMPISRGPASSCVRNSLQSARGTRAPWRASRASLCAILVIVTQRFVARRPPRASVPVISSGMGALLVDGLTKRFNTQALHGIDKALVGMTPYQVDLEQALDYIGHFVAR